MHLIRNLRGLKKEDYQRSYAQCGEDLIAAFLLDALKVSEPTYLDVGAHHPIRLSNTYLFYERRCRGVCVEPDPDLYAQLKKIRKRDLCLRVGVSAARRTQADLYIMSNRALNTCSREEAERIQSFGNHRIEKILQIPLVPANDILRDYFTACPNFVSLDVEGFEFDVVKTIDFSKFRPEVFCIETLTYREDGTEKKTAGIIEYMAREGYFLYADTYINSIFVDRQIWSRRQ